MKKLKLWSLWVLAMARFDTRRAKQLADEITRLQKGKPPMNHMNLGG